MSVLLTPQGKKQFLQTNKWHSQAYFTGITEFKIGFKYNLINEGEMRWCGCSNSQSTNREKTSRYRSGLLNSIDGDTASRVRSTLYKSIRLT